MSDLSHDRIVTLANGSSVSLGAAVGALGLLRSYLELQDLEWEAVYFLREVCLGRPIEPEQSRTLVREKLLQADGTPDPVMKAVILSAVRGQGRVLHLSPPFTDLLDQAMADYIGARDLVVEGLGLEAANEFFQSDPLRGGDAIRKMLAEIPLPHDRDKSIKDILGKVAKNRNWTDATKQPPSSPDNISPT